MLIPLHIFLVFRLSFLIHSTAQHCTYRQPNSNLAINFILAANKHSQPRQQQTGKSRTVQLSLRMLCVNIQYVAEYRVTWKSQITKLKTREFVTAAEDRYIVVTTAETELWSRRELPMIQVCTTQSLLLTDPIYSNAYAMSSWNKLLTLKTIRDVYENMCIQTTGSMFNVHEEQQQTWTLTQTIQPQKSHGSENMKKREHLVIQNKHFNYKTIQLYIVWRKIRMAVIINQMRLLVLAGAGVSKRTEKSHEFIRERSATKSTVCTLYNHTAASQLSSAAAATRRRHLGLVIAGSWRLGLRSSRMQSTPVGTAPQKNQEPSAETTMHDCHYWPINWVNV